MTSERATELFSEHFEGTLTGGLKQEFERHLAENPATSHDYAVFCKVLGSFNGLPEVPVPAGLPDKIARRLDHADWERKQTVRGSHKWFRLGLMAATTACVAVIGVISWNSINGGVSAGILPTAASPEPLTVLKIGDELRIRLVPSEATTLRILRGGSEGTLRPSDGLLVREEQLTANQAINIPLTDSGTNRQILYVEIKGLPTQTAVIYPGIKSAPQGLLSVLCEISSKHSVVISVTAVELKPILDVQLAGELEANLDSALEGSGLRFTKKNGIIEIR